MKSLIILLFATVIASGDAAQKCEEVTDPCASVRADAAPIYENLNRDFKAIDDRCTAQLEALEPGLVSEVSLSKEIGDIISACSADLQAAIRTALPFLGRLVGMDPPESYGNIIRTTEREGMSACLVENDNALSTSFRNIRINLLAVAESIRL